MLCHFDSCGLLLIQSQPTIAMLYDTINTPISGALIYIVQF